MLGIQNYPNSINDNLLIKFDKLKDILNPKK